MAPNFAVRWFDRNGRFRVSRPLPNAPTKVRLLNRLPTLDLGGGDYSSCPEAGLHLFGRADLRENSVAALLPMHPRYIFVGYRAASRKRCNMRPHNLSVALQGLRELEFKRLASFNEGTVGIFRTSAGVSPGSAIPRMMSFFMSWGARSASLS
jgi:hypothetical protein